MNKIALRVGTSLLGMIVVLAWWTLTGKKDHSSGPAQGIPVKAWEGGASTLKIDVETTDAARMGVYLANGEYKNGKPQRSLDTFELVESGPHSWTIDIPAQTGGLLELEAKNPKPGSTLTWTITSNGRELAKESETLNQPLNANEAFFLQLELDDFVNPPNQEEEKSSTENN